MMAEKAGSAHEVAVSNDETEQPSRDAHVVSLRQKGLSFQQIGDEIGVSKSTAFRIWKDANVAPQAPAQARKRQAPSESLEGLPPIPGEPIEFLSDGELHETEKRLKRELSVKRMLARSRWLDFMAQNPQRYQGYMANDGHANKKDDDFRDRILFELLKDRGKQNEAFGVKDFFGAVLNMQQNQAESNWRFYDKMAEALANMKGSSDLPPEAQIQLKKMDMEFQRWQTEKAESAKKWENILQAVAPGLGQLPAVIGGLFGKKGTGNHSTQSITQMPCKQCGVVFPVSVADVEARKPLVCSVCGAVHKPVEESQDGKTEDSTAS